MLYQQLKRNKQREKILMVVAVLIYLFYLNAILVTIASFFYLQSEADHVKLDYQAMTEVLLVVAIGLFIYTFKKLKKRYQEWMYRILSYWQYKAIDQNSDIGEMISNLAMVAQIPVPNVYMIADDSYNAFSIGFKTDKSIIVLTEGLIQHFQAYELEAVLAHEVAHIKSGDSRLASLSGLLLSDARENVGTASIVSCFVVGISYLIGTLLMFYYGGINGLTMFFYGCMFYLVVIYITPLVESIANGLLLHGCELSADTGAVNLTRNPNALIKALEKLKQSPTMNGEINHSLLYIVNPKLNMVRHGEVQSSDWLTRKTNIYPRISDQIQYVKQL